MNEDTTPTTGPALVVTTRYLRRGPRRVALKTRAITIPGTFQLSKVIGASVGGAVALALSAGPAMALGMWQLAMVFAVFGALGGVLVTSWSPLKGESFMRWMVLWSARRMGLVKVGGRYVRAYVGAAPVQRAPFGMSQMVRSYVDVASVRDDATPPPTPATSDPVPHSSLPVLGDVPIQSRPETGGVVMGRRVDLSPPAAVAPTATASRAG